MSEAPDQPETAEPSIDPEVDLDWNREQHGTMADYADNTEPDTED